jgi:predicted MFS family arabinose efflux permease
MKRSTVWLLTVASGVAVANLYYNQPLLAEIGRSLNVSAQQVGYIPTLTQIGYAIGLLLIVPLGDMIERRRLLVTMFAIRISPGYCHHSPIGFGGTGDKRVTSVPPATN